MMNEKRESLLGEKEYNLCAMKVVNNTARLGFICALGVGILAICSKINVNVNIRAGDLDRDELADEGVTIERKRIVNNLKEKSYSEEQIADLLDVSLEDVKSISE